PRRRRDSDPGPCWHTAVAQSLQEYSTMFRNMLTRGALWGGLTLLVLVPPPATPQTYINKGQPFTQTPAKVQPKLEPIAETRLLMDGITHPNFRGIERLLAEKPADVQVWTFARGQALLIAEAGNLLMLRPPKSQGQALWFDRAME